MTKPGFPRLKARDTFLQALPLELLEEISSFPYLAIRNYGFSWLADRKASEVEVGETPQTTRIGSLPPDLRDEIRGFCLPTLRRTRKVDPEAKDFFSLPLELRNQIYLNLLVSPHRLRSPQEFRRRQIQKHNQGGNRKAQATQIFQTTAILATCSTINNEAVPVFYKHNRFHYSIPLHRIPFSRLQTPYLEHMQHLSIDFAHTWPSSFTSFDSYRPGRVDSIIANHISGISAKCPSLCSFTLHILADPGFMPVIELALDNPNPPQRTRFSAWTSASIRVL